MGSSFAHSEVEVVGARREILQSWIGGAGLLFFSFRGFSFLRGEECLRPITGIELDYYLCQPFLVSVAAFQGHWSFR